MTGKQRRQSTAEGKQCHIADFYSLFFLPRYKCCSLLACAVCVLLWLQAELAMVGWRSCMQHRHSPMLEFLPVGYQAPLLASRHCLRFGDYVHDDHFDSSPHTCCCTNLLLQSQHQRCCVQVPDMRSCFLCLELESPQGLRVVSVRYRVVICGKHYRERSLHLANGPAAGVTYTSMYYSIVFIVAASTAQFGADLSMIARVCSHAAALCM